jgi:predicted acylesterase/phospholipase RssA
MGSGITNAARFVYATAKVTSVIWRLRTYDSKRHVPVINPKIWQAALATSAATSFFDPAEIDGLQFADRALGANSPVDEVENEARGIWCPSRGDLKPVVKCFVSVGTGYPGKKPIEDKFWKFFGGSLVALTAETEATARIFIDRWRSHYDERRYFRLNV